jgi:hypothetical protein
MCDKVLLASRHEFSRAISVGYRAFSAYYNSFAIRSRWHAWIDRSGAEACDALSSRAMFVRRARVIGVLCAIGSLSLLDACGSFDEPPASAGAGASSGFGGAGARGGQGQGGAGVFAGSGGCPGYVCFDCATGDAVPATCESGRLCPEGFTIDCGSGGSGAIGGAAGRGGSGSGGRGGSAGSGATGGSAGAADAGGGSGGSGGSGGEDAGSGDASGGTGPGDASVE